MPRPGEQTRDAIAAAAEEFDAQVASGPRVLALAVLLTGAAAPLVGAVAQSAFAASTCTGSMTGGGTDKDGGEGGCGVS